MDIGMDGLSTAEYIEIIDKQVKEIERLREALEKIAGCIEDGYTEYYIKTAKQALKGE